MVFLILRGMFTFKNDAPINMNEFLNESVNWQNIIPFFLRFGNGPHPVSHFQLISIRTIIT